MDIDTTSDLGFFCECSGHSGGRSERFDTCGKPTSLGVFMCEECRLGKPLCWDSTCPTATFYLTSGRPSARSTPAWGAEPHKERLTGRDDHP